MNSGQKPNYEIILVPDPILRETAQAVSRVDDQVRAQMDRMLQTMYDAPGIGLAANQVRILNRVLVMDLARRQVDEEGGVQTPKPIFMANPEVIWESEELSVMEEGCLSVRWLYGQVKRSTKVTVSACDINGKKFTRSGSGLLAQIFQHETDHLDGILFTEKAKGVREYTPPHQD